MAQTAALKSSAKENVLNVGLEREDRRKLADHLGECLADTYMLYVKTQSFHWNVVGPMFYGLHKLTEAQYEDMADAIDEIAERIRAIGFIAPGSFSQFVGMSHVEEETGAPSAEVMIKQLADGNEVCARRLRQAASEAEAVEDIRTADMLTARVGQHEENVWMLKALLQ